MSTTNLLTVAESWAHADDWGLAVIELSTLRELDDALRAGDNPVALKDHAHHTAARCLLRGCANRIPNFVRVQS
jgi:hypothetical protein